MHDKFWQAIAGIAAVLVAGILIWLTAGGGTATVLSWFSPAKIEVSSVGRGQQATYFAGEVLRFTLKGPQATHAYWIFDESDVKPGNVEIQNLFPYDSKQPSISENRRVDVFYKVAGVYRTAYAVVPVENQQLVSSKVQDGAISLNTSPAENNNWKLMGVSLDKYEGGYFKKEVSLAAGQNVSVSRSLLEKLGISFGSKWDPEKTSAAVASFDFISPDGKTVRTVQPLDAQIKQLQAGGPQ